MKFASSGDTLEKTVRAMIEQAKRLSITTIGGDKFEAYEPISFGHDYIAFSTSLRADDTVAIRWEAIAAVTVAHSESQPVQIDLRQGLFR